MKRKSLNGGVMAGLLIVFMLLGVVIGMLIVHFSNKSKIAELERKAKEAQPVIQNIQNEEVYKFYYPQRNFNPGQIPRNSYNTENFRIDDGFMAYFDESGNKISHLGIDVSYHQTSIDWDKLMASPVEFIMLRCGYRGYSEGGLIEDEKFREYATEANARGLNMGVYFFTQAINEEEARAEADFVIKLLKDYKLQYPVAFDTEYVSDDEARTNTVEISKEERSKICIAFCERIREAGYFPMIYASENWMRRQLDLEMLTEYDFWAPQYLDENDFLFDFTIWQYTEKGNVPGIGEEVDLNISMVDYASFVPDLMKVHEEDGSFEFLGPALVDDGTIGIPRDISDGEPIIPEDN